MIRSSNGVFFFVHPRTNVTWTSDSFWGALRLFGWAVHGVHDLHSAIMAYERAVFA